ncbi:RidA family protein [Dactylosporangium sp. CA-139066]|uniref:RidA family protein n=1 Tax=Dactylosporangium sp. CA-139066 TaxID=3239930 RepID=UPI003D8D41FB
MQSTVIHTTKAPAPGAAYSQARTAGPFLFTSGCGPIDATSGQIVGTGVTEQTQLTVANLRALLAADGLDLTDVVKVTVYLQDLDRDYDEFNRAYAELMPKPWPARTTVGADLTGILVEIDFVALRRSGT